ncbi:DUF4386 domain-containing protein [Taibaiella koreensis]|uniref:DUF4386 domain-containing protein n=1 Tax=Taibaiella koreensis TaxID=1268548 RepID=UPI000E59C610|nr:DUF4386 domain-containing protein [Taibaiella koreensis]
MCLRYITQTGIKWEHQTPPLAGFLYLVVILTGMFSLAYIPSKLIAWDDAGLTFRNIASARQLFRLGIASSMLCYIAFLLLPLALYQLLRPVNISYARLIAVLAIVSVPISLYNLEHKFAVLSLTGHAGYLKAYDLVQLSSQVMFQLEQYDSGIRIAGIFWGLWLLPLGLLIYRSGMLPKVLAVLLLLGGLGYIIRVLGDTVVPHFGRYSFSSYITLPATAGEMGTCLWLLIFGVRRKAEKNDVTR